MGGPNSITVFYKSSDKMICGMGFKNDGYPSFIGLNLAKILRSHRLTLARAQASRVSMKPYMPALAMDVMAGMREVVEVMMSAFSRQSAMASSGFAMSMAMMPQLKFQLVPADEVPEHQYDYEYHLFEDRIVVKKRVYDEESEESHSVDMHESDWNHDDSFLAFCESSKDGVDE